MPSEKLFPARTDEGVRHGNGHTSGWDDSHERAEVARAPLVERVTTPCTVGAVTVIVEVHCQLVCMSG